MFILNFDRKSIRQNYPPKWNSYSSEFLNYRSWRREGNRDSSKTLISVSPMSWHMTWNPTSGLGWGGQQDRQALSIFFQDTKPILIRRWLLLSNLKKASRVFSSLSVWGFQPATLNGTLNHTARCNLHKETRKLKLQIIFQCLKSFDNMWKAIFTIHF